MRDLFVVDLEATCHPAGQEPPGFFSEIIEIGMAIASPRRGTVLRLPSLLVRPALFPALSAFCTDLTTITQAELDAGAVPLPQALVTMAVARPEDAVFASYGYYDRNMILRQCERFSLPYPLGNPERHINVKVEAADFYHVRRGSVPETLKRLGVEFDGTLHRGGDDAYNIARIALRMAQDGWTHHLLLP